MYNLLIQNNKSIILLFKYLYYILITFKFSTLNHDFFILFWIVKHNIFLVCTIQPSAKLYVSKS